MSGPTNQNPGLFHNLTASVANAIWGQPQQAAVVEQLQASTAALEEAARLAKEAHKQALGNSLSKIKEESDKKAHKKQFEGPLNQVQARIQEIEAKIEKAKAAVAEAKRVVELGFAPGSNPTEKQKRRAQGY